MSQLENKGMSWSDFIGYRDKAFAAGDNPENATWSVPGYGDFKGSSTSTLVPGQAPSKAQSPSYYYDGYHEGPNNTTVGNRDLVTDQYNAFTDKWLPLIGAAAITAGMGSQFVGAAGAGGGGGGVGLGGAGGAAGAAGDFGLAAAGEAGAGMGAGAGLGGVGGAAGAAGDFGLAAGGGAGLGAESLAAAGGAPQIGAAYNAALDLPGGLDIGAGGLGGASGLSGVGGVSGLAAGAGEAAAGGGLLSSLGGINSSGLLQAGGTLASILGANKAAQAQQDAANAATAEQRRQYDLTRSDMLTQQGKTEANFKPWLTAGTDAVNQLGAGVQPGGQFTKNFSQADYQADPGYAFTLSEGQKGIYRAASARGSPYSGATLKALSRFNSDQASQEYSNAYSRYNNDKTTQFNRLSSLAGTGQQAGNTLASTGQGTQNNLSSIGQSTATNIGNNMTGAGNARASGYVGTTNAINNGIGQYFNSQQNAGLLSALSGRS